MPSGSKKRKAAKKKNQTQSSNNHPDLPASPQTHGEGDDLKPRDDMDSDAGEVSSPESPDRHNSKNSFSSGEVEIERGIVSYPLEGTEIAIFDEPYKTPAEGESESKIENEFDKIDKQFQHDDTASQFYHRGPSRSSNSPSSSDDESSDEIKNSQSKTLTISGEKAKLDMGSEENETGPSIKEPEIKKSGVERGSLDEGEVGILEVITPSAEYVGAISETRECIAQESDDPLSLSFNAPVLSADLEKESGVSEPLLARDPPRAEGPEPRTSWKSCCGLFEVLTRAGR